VEEHRTEAAEVTEGDPGLVAEILRGVRARTGRNGEAHRTEVAERDGGWWPKFYR
jgi:hypothetical protein